VLLVQAIGAVVAFGIALLRRPPVPPLAASTSV